MNERIRQLAEQAYQLCGKHSNDYNGPAFTEKFAELIIRECLNDFYRQYFDDESEDISTQIERYVEDTFRGNDRLDQIEVQLRQQAEDKNT